MNLILAADKNWAIGYRGGLLAHIHGDMKFFREMTTGKTVVMGRKTLESLPGGKGLPNRKNYVLTTRPDYQAENAEVVHTEEELKKALSGEEPENVFVIGGAQVYEELLPQCDTCYITKIDAEYPADRYFRNLDEDPAFELAYESERMEEKGTEYRFLRYERRK